MINLTTGPVEVLQEVTNAFIQTPISHRSSEFIELYQYLTRTISQQLSVKDTFILTGSGTLANEIMIAQIVAQRQQGLILSNGEFGSRLIVQAQRQQAHFEIYKTNWGENFDIDRICNIIKTKQIKWLLFCHCESSTGIINPLGKIAKVCKEYDCEVYIDCISTFGNMEIDLSHVAMATASSGKGVGSYAGLALIFCNKQIVSNQLIPFYLDLLYAQKMDGIPFTLSSNLLSALNEAVKLNMTKKRWDILDKYSESIYTCLRLTDLIPFATRNSRIFTINLNGASSGDVAMSFLKADIQLSFQSNYLTERNWLQLVLFGSYQLDKIDILLSTLTKILVKTNLVSSKINLI